MTELQGSLGAESAKVTAAGAPVDVTAAPQMGASPFAGMASPLMSMATKGAQAGIQAGTGAASAASSAAGQNAVKATDTATAPVGGGAAAGAAPIGGGAGGGGAGVGTSAPRSIATSTMVQPESAATSNQSATVRGGAVAGMGGAGMMGAPYAPMAGQGANASANNHTAASFLHTSDQGGEIVGDLGTATPPVLGEADPTEPPDVELRI
jgi:hypothetical protein